MGSKVIKPKLLGQALREALDRHKDLTLEQSNKALRVAVIKTWGNIIEGTPVDEGRARGNWFVTIGSPSNQLGSKDSNKGSNYVRTATQKNMFGFKWFLTNNLPYINKLEFGGYSQGPGATSKTNSNGFSELAPKGMVRINLIKWPRVLREAFKGIAK